MAYDNTQMMAEAVNTLKKAILQSQARAIKAVNQEQLALYYGVGRYISFNTRNKNWGTGMIKSISQRLRSELPGLRGFSETNLKNMRTFYEAWKRIEANSSVTTDELKAIPAIISHDYSETAETEEDTIRQLQLTNLENFPIVPFLSISFTHHITILSNAKDWEERLFYIQFAADNKITADELVAYIKKDLYHHQGQMPNNFLTTIPDYKQAYRAISMFKDEYLLDYINVEELGMHDEEIDERIIEQSIVHNIKNFIMTFGKGFTFNGSQVHYDKLGHDHWIDLLFYNRDLRRLVVFEVSDPDSPSYLLIANDPEMESIIGALNALILNRLVTRVNTGQGKNIPVSIIVDELPTLYFHKIDRLIGTARSNKVSVTLGFQELPQLEADYGKVGMQKIITTVGNVVSGSARAKETLEWLSNDIFGKVVQLKKGVTIDREKTSINLNENMDSLVPASKISDLPTGWICGQVARDFIVTKTGRGNKMDIQEAEEFKTSKFFCKTDFDMKEIKDEEAQYPNCPIPKFYTFPSREARERVLYDLYIQVTKDVKQMIDEIFAKKNAR